MSQRLIIAIGISAFVGVLLLVALNVFAAFQRGPVSSPVTGTRPSPGATIGAPATPSAKPGGTPGSASPSLVATPSSGRSPSSGPVGVEANQSAGTVTLTITAPEALEVSSPAVCEWAADEPLRVEQIVSVQDAVLEINGERVALQVRTAAVTDPTSERAPFLIRRLTGTGAGQRAPYGVSSPAEGEYTIEPDSTTGTMTFKGLGTAAATIPADLLPVRRSIYGRPLGDSASWREIDAILTWRCDGAPAGFAPTPAQPTASPDDPAGLRAPDVSLVLGGDRRPGTAGCLEAATSQDGQHTGGDECESAWVAPAYLPPVLAARVGTRIGVSLEPGWRIAAWNIRASTVADVEATLGKPARSVVLFRGDATDPVRSLGFRAPPNGTWIVRATLETRGPGSATARTTYFFLVRSS